MSTCQGSPTSHDKGVHVHMNRESKSTWQGSPTRWQLRESKSTWREWKKKKPVHKMWSRETHLRTTWSREMRPSPQHHNSEKRVLVACVAFHKTGGWGTQLHTTGSLNPHDLNEETTEKKPPHPPKKHTQGECDDKTSGCDSTRHGKDAAPQTFRMWPLVWHERGDCNLAQHNNYVTQHNTEGKKVPPHDMKVKKAIPHDATEKSANPHTHEWFLHDARYTFTPNGKVK